MTIAFNEKKSADDKNKNRKRIKRRKQNVISIMTPSDNCQENLQQYVEEAVKLHKPLFNFGINWDSNVWDIRGFESTVTTRSVTNACNILFTQDNGLGKKIKAAKDKEIPFAEPYLSQVKAFITHKHHQRRCKHDSHMVHMRAFRYLYKQLTNRITPSFTQLLPSHFDEALRYAMKNKEEASSTLSITGERLGNIAAEIDAFKLTHIPLEWSNPIPRHSSRGGASHNRNTKKAKERRAKMLPKTDVLVFLSALWVRYDDLEEKDKSLICMAVILMIAGFRMDEFVALDINCIPSREEYEEADLELDPQTGTYIKPLRIRALAKKKNHWDEKIVPPIAVDVIFEAVERLKKLSSPHRQTAYTLLQEDKWDKFNSFGEDEVLSAKEIKSHLGISGHSSSNTISSLQRMGIERYSDAISRSVSFRVGDIHEAVSDRYKQRIQPLKEGLGHGELIIPIWEFLTLRFLDQYTPKERFNVFAEPLTGTQIQDFFRGRDYTTRVQKSGGGGQPARILSVFERYKFPEIKEFEDTVHTHQFRHLLNTLMQESDMFSQEDIAKNFLRKNTQDNSDYNHQIEPKQFAERTTHFQKNVLKNLNIDENQAKDVIQRFPLLSNEELQQDLDESGSYHFMTIGQCRHDYTQLPCGMHYMCLRNCSNYKRTKGNAEEIKNITERRDTALKQMNLAKKDADDEFTGANNWYLNHKELVDGCNIALSIEDNPECKLGDVIQIFPRGIDRCDEDLNE
jgi:hypothetical protein